MSMPAAPFAHLVVASDLKPASDEALLRAHALAHRLGARLTVLHVVEPLPVVSAWGDPGGVVWSGLDALLEAGRAGLAKHLAKGPALQDPVPEQAVRLGNPRRDLGTLAAELGGDLMVVGSRRDRGLGDRLLGSTTQAVVHQVRMPLLVVRRPAAAGWQQVLAAVDESEAARQAVVLAAGIAPEAKRRLLHVHPPLPEATIGLVQPDPGSLGDYARAAEKAATERFDAIAKDFPSWTAEFRRGPVIDTVLAEITDRAPDLVALGTQGRGPWIGGLLGSVSQAVVAHADVDVLLVPSKT